VKTTVYENPDAVARAAADMLQGMLAEGLGSVVLAGGSTPHRMYQLLQPGPAWARVTALFGDERCVPPEDPESNYRMAFADLLSRVHPANVHRMPGELGAEEAARRYEEVVARYSPLDVVLLGMGPDGHTASLFPGAPELAAQGLVAPVHNAPKPPPDRVTLTLPALRAARRVVFLVTGADKADAVLLASRGEVPSGMIPGAEYLLDRAAAARL
jgi:6-phosphogluconolactonase